MSKTTRLLVVVGAVVIAVAVFVVLSPSDGNDEVADTTTTEAPTAAATPTTETTPAPPPKPKPQLIEVRNAEPVGGVQAIDTTKGETVRFVVRSDIADEVHVHGYDISRDAAPGKPARFSFEASIEGIFEIELEHRAVEIATLTVEP